MSVRELIPRRRKTVDVRLRYRGYWSEGGVCRIRVFEAPGEVPVVVSSELAENTNTSVTNLAEYLAAEVIARFLPHRFEADPPIVWVEHYPGRRDPRRNLTGRPEFDRVTFASWTPRVCVLGGVRRTRCSTTIRTAGALTRLEGHWSAMLASRIMSPATDRGSTGREHRADVDEHPGEA